MTGSAIVRWIVKALQPEPTWFVSQLSPLSATIAFPRAASSAARCPKSLNKSKACQIRSQWRSSGGWHETSSYKGTGLGLDLLQDALACESSPHLASLVSGQYLFMR